MFIQMEYLNRLTQLIQLLHLPLIVKVALFTIQARQLAHLKVGNAQYLVHLELGFQWEIYNMKTFTLEDKEAEFILQVIGQLPTQSGAFPLFQKLQQQYALITEEPTQPQE